MYDIAIIGGGPAGLAAAVNARRRNKAAIIAGKENHSSKLIQSHLIDNYLGLPRITGAELAARMRQHAEDLGVVFAKDEVQNIYSDNGKFYLTGRENVIEARAVILAVGVSLGQAIQGEESWIGKGVSYCATCDGMFFKGKTVAMIGYIPEAEGEANFLAEVCAKVYFLPQYKMDQAQASLDPRITILQQKPLAITGTNQVETLQTTKDELALDGVFIERSSLPMDHLMAGLEVVDGFIVTGAGQQTNLPGVFAAGDCTGKPWQINRAVGQGQVAALSAVHFLEQNNS
ncbi:MAG: FAD-dependent oxidoreductase [Firmicutes bacterium]|nr:FAD-dependent oxidoreductase [Bacillota bacterium]